MNRADYFHCTQTSTIISSLTSIISVLDDSKQLVCFFYASILCFVSSFIRQNAYCFTMIRHMSNSVRRRWYTDGLERKMHNSTKRAQHTLALYPSNQWKMPHQCYQRRLLSKTKDKPKPSTFTSTTQSDGKQPPSSIVASVPTWTQLVEKATSDPGNLVMNAGAVLSLSGLYVVLK